MLRNPRRNIWQFKIQKILMSLIFNLKIDIKKIKDKTYLFFYD